MNKFFGVIAGFLLACLPAAAQTQQPIRINCGGPAYTDTNSQLWKGDTGYNAGTALTTNATTAGTTDPALYQSFRYNSAAAPMIYSVPVANGSYRVNLLFAESTPTAQAVGARVFNVKLNGSVVLQNFDIYAAAGAKRRGGESFQCSCDEWLDSHRV